MMLYHGPSAQILLHQGQRQLSEAQKAKAMANNELNIHFLVLSPGGCSYQGAAGQAAR